MRDLEPGCVVDPGLLVNSVFQRLARFLADGVAVLKETHLVDLGQRVGHRVGQLVQLVAVDPHSTALYFLASSVFTFLNISAYCAPDLAHLFGVGVKNHAHLFVDAVLKR